MKFVVGLFCILSLASAGGLMANVGSNCDSTLTGYTVSSFNVTPWPPSKNTNMSMTMAGTMNVAATLKAMVIPVIVDGLHFYTETVPESGTYAAGQAATINFKVSIPGIAPSGKYVIQVKLETTSGAYLNCWSINFSL